MYKLYGLLAKPLGYALIFIYNLVGSYGISLIILTFIVKLVLYPLYMKQIKSTANMTDLQPKIKQIQKKYADNKEMMNEKMAELYKEEGFSPAAGCLPMIIQMPIIFGLFALLRNPVVYISDPKMLFAVHESFLWMSDLSHPDKWILPILAGIATFISFSISQNQQVAQADGAGAGAGSMIKVMKYIFPAMIVIMARTYPAGLAIYWFFGQFMQIFFNIHMNHIRKNMKKEREEKEKKAKGGRK